METGIELIAEERREQIEKHGFDVLHNQEYYEGGQLIGAALFAITGDDKFYPQEWGDWWLKKMFAKVGSRVQLNIERFKIAGALIAAEIDRLQAGRKWIKIIKCSSNDYWYKNLVGKTFLVLKEDEIGYCTKIGRLCEDYVRFSDAIEVPNSEPAAQESDTSKAT
jgi:hypothetical protein